MEEKKNVRIRLFKDNSRYKGDLFVSVNGVNYKIRRGVEVEVPPEVAEVLEHSQQQDEYTAARIAAAENCGPVKEKRGPAETAEKGRRCRAFYGKSERRLFMTVGEAMERAEELRPGSRVAARTRQRWLREVDGMLRGAVLSAPAVPTAGEGVGADLAWDDGLRDDDVLLVPPPFDSLYPHYLCAMTDAALGETDRYAGEQAQYNSILAELAGWLRRNYPARTGQ